MIVTLKRGDVVLYEDEDIDHDSFVVVSDVIVIDWPNGGTRYVSVMYLIDGMMSSEPETAVLYDEAVYLPS